MSFQCEKCFTCFTTSYLYNRHMNKKTSCIPNDKLAKSSKRNHVEYKSSDIAELKNMILNLQGAINNYESSIKNPTSTNTTNITTTTNTNTNNHIIINKITGEITIRTVKSVCTDKKLIAN
jgi:predicted membrane protein